MRLSDDVSRTLRVAMAAAKDAEASNVRFEDLVTAVEAMKVVVRAKDTERLPSGDLLR